MRNKGLLGVIERYDAEQEARIRQLEQDNEVLRRQNNELNTLLMRSTATNERKTLELIMSGHFDRFVKKEKGDVCPICNGIKFIRTGLEEDPVECPDCS